MSEVIQNYGLSDIILLSRDSGQTWEAYHATEASQASNGSTKEEAIGRLILGSPSSFGITIDTNDEMDRPFYVKRGTDYHVGDGQMPEWGMRLNAKGYTKAEAYARRARIASSTNYAVFAERGQIR